MRREHEEELERLEREHYPNWGALRISRAVEDLVAAIVRLCEILRPRPQSATLHILGENGMSTIQVGKTGQVQWKEWSGPSGSGTELAPAGPETYTSSDSNVATVDASGLVTAVAPGSVTISGVDSTDNLSASGTVDVPAPVPVAQSATLEVVPS